MSFLSHPEPEVHIAGDELGRSYTPDACAEAVMRRVAVLLPEDGARVLEPCVGGGAFVRAARRVLWRPMVDGVDIDPDAPGGALCDEFMVADFAAFIDVPGAGYDLAVSNPPFGKAVGQATTIAIVQAARKAATVCAMVVPLGYLGQSGWEPLVRECLYVWPLLPRPWEHEREMVALVWRQGSKRSDARLWPLRWKGGA